MVRYKALIYAITTIRPQCLPSWRLIWSDPKYCRKIISQRCFYLCNCLWFSSGKANCAEGCAGEQQMAGSCTTGWEGQSAASPGGHTAAEKRKTGPLLSSAVTETNGTHNAGQLQAGTLTCWNNFDCWLYWGFSSVSDYTHYLHWYGSFSLPSEFHPWGASAGPWLFFLFQVSTYYSFCSLW